MCRIASQRSYWSRTNVSGLSQVVSASHRVSVLSTRVRVEDPMHTFRSRVCGNLTQVSYGADRWFDEDTRAAIALEGLHEKVQTILACVDAWLAYLTQRRKVFWSAYLSSGKAPPVCSISYDRTHQRPSLTLLDVRNKKERHRVNIIHVIYYAECCAE